MGLFTLILACGILFYLFNSGQILRERTLATNAADAAAYSGGLTMARVMNFEAYTNRAVMANVVVIGQLTALASWGRYIGHGIGQSYEDKNPDPASICLQFCLTDEGDTAVALTYAGNAVLEAYTGIDIFEYWRDYQPTVEAILSAGITFSAVAIEALQPPIVKDVLLATMPIARQRAIQDAVDRNYDGYGDAQGTGVLVQDTFYSFEGDGPMIRQHRGDDRERLRATAEAAAFEDPFVEERRWERESLVPSCVDHRGVHFDRLKRGGGSHLGLDDWEAIDTSSWHEKTKRHGRCRTRERPFGYGSAEVGRDSGLSTLDMGGSGANPRAADRATSSDASASLWGFAGLPSFFELSPAARKAERPVARFAERVNRASDALHVTGRAAETQAAGRFELMGDGDGRSMAAVAAVEVFFERLTEREDGHDELASLFNPFWHARLVAPSEAAIAETVLTQ